MAGGGEWWRDAEARAKASAIAQSHAAQLRLQRMKCQAGQARAATGGFPYFTETNSTFER